MGTQTVTRNKCAVIVNQWRWCWLVFRHNTTASRQKCCASRGNIIHSQIHCARVPINGNVEIGVTVTNNSARSDFVTERPGYAGMDYDPINDRFLFMAGQTRSVDGNVTGNLPGKVYTVSRVTDNEYSLGILSLTGPTPAPVIGAGVNGRFKFVPRLNIFVYAPRFTANLYCFRVG
jgi:hypothetical protein